MRSGLRGPLLGLLALALGSVPVAAAETREECRARLGADRPTALERWRGPRSNANRYPAYCENERFLGRVGEIPRITPPDIPSGTSLEMNVPPPPPPPASLSGP